MSPLPSSSSFPILAYPHSYSNRQLFAATTVVSASLLLILMLILSTILRLHSSDQNGFNNIDFKEQHQEDQLLNSYHRDNVLIKRSLLSSNRKMLSSSSLSSSSSRSSLFDFTPFLHRMPAEEAGDREGSGIDPIYGEEKRLVPTGPNPLHH
ncbi:hypothetical protein QQ045_025951 [Rhodiola kirilowii]